MGIFRALIVAAFISARAAGANAIGDAPELAAPGPAAVGLTEKAIVHRDQVDPLRAACEPTHCHERSIAAPHGVVPR